MTFAKFIHTFIKAREHHEELGQFKETEIRGAFHQLIEAVMNSLAVGANKFDFHTERTEKNAYGRTISYDFAVVKSAIVRGIVENKDCDDDLDKERLKKQSSDYAEFNIIYENGYEALLVQDSAVVARAVYKQSRASQAKRYRDREADLEQFDALLQRFVAHITAQDRGYEETLGNFKTAVPQISDKVKAEIADKLANDATFVQNFNTFLYDFGQTIDHNIKESDVIEVMVQHILTADLFHEILGSDTYRRYNTIAKSLDELSNQLGRKFDLEIDMYVRPFYHQVVRAMRDMNDDNYRVELLRVFYEEFYKAYNPLAGDTLGIVYTPKSLVDFMINTADLLLYEHFGKHIFSKNVQILDPCTGTGSYVVALLEYIFTHASAELEHKYHKELHANEISILSYYIGNLQIELKYQELARKLGSSTLFDEFANMCYVDSLENDFASRHAGAAGAPELGKDWGLSAENARRVKAQNDHDVRLIIGNPPYNANQKNENQNNKNKVYPVMDMRIKETYTAASTAQKTKYGDMYVRFIRWASDRLQGEGIVAFVTNRSYLDALGFDGMRKCLAGDFSHIYIVDLGGDVRKNGKLSGTKNNVFGIQTGVCMGFFVQSNKGREGIYYCNPFDELETAMNKHYWLRQHSSLDKLNEINWRYIEPDERGNWLMQSESNFADLLALGNKKTKGKESAEAVFALYSNGVLTARDGWVYDRDVQQLTIKMRYFIAFYESEVIRWAAVPEAAKGATAEAKQRYLDSFVDTKIKWERELKAVMKRGLVAPFDENKIITTIYRPFRTRYYYYEPLYMNCTSQMPSIFPTGKQGENVMICVSGSSHINFIVLISDMIIDLNGLSPANGGAQCFPRWRYTPDGSRVANFAALRPAFAALTDDELFHYIYAVLHHPAYRQAYALDLKQNLPAVPVSPHAKALAALGQQLAELHLNFATAPLYPLTITRVDNHGVPSLPVLKSESAKGEVRIDKHTTVSGIPAEAWGYTLGNRSAIDWVLEGYKETKPRPDDGAIGDIYSDLYTAHGYQKYTFAPHKEECIEQVARIISLSLETQRLVAEIEEWGLG